MASFRFLVFLFNQGTISNEKTACPATVKNLFFFKRFKNNFFLDRGASIIAISNANFSFKALYTHRELSQSEARNIIFLFCIRARKELKN
jgi:hypothetical protein